MESPIISILMPVHNAANTLADAVDSIRCQTCNRWELIAADDGSTDASLDILKQHARLDKRITALQLSRQGIVAALNAAAARARAPLLARMDADDVALPERLEAQAAMFADHAALALCGCRVRMSGPDLGSGRKRYERWINGLLRHEDIARELFVECPLPHPTFMMRRQIFDAVGGYLDFGWPEDYDLVMRVWLAGGMMAKHNDVLLEWRHRPDRLSMTDERYGDTAFRALKRHYLHEAAAREQQRDTPSPIAAFPATFYQWGAGEVGKKWLREWRPKPQAVVDINPRKIGRSIHGVPVITPDELPPPGRVPIVIAVGAPGARDEIRDWLTPRGYRETRDYVFLA